jgi:hypothetical protein
MKNNIIGQACIFLKGLCHYTFELWFFFSVVDSDLNTVGSGPFWSKI